MAPLHQARVTDVGSLRESGRARRVDVESAIVDGYRPALGAVQFFARVPLNLAIDVRVSVAAVAVDRDLRVALKVWHRGREPIHQFRGYDDVPGRGDIHAVRERWTGEIGIGQRNHAAKPRDSKPDRHAPSPLVR